MTPFVLVLVCLILGTYSIECYRAQSRVDLYNGEPVTYSATATTRECPNERFKCAAVRKVGFSRERDAPPNDTRSWSALSLGCGREEACKRILGDSGVGCRYAQYFWTFVDPQSCDQNDTVFYNQVTRMYYGCCDSEDLCIDEDDITLEALNDQCTENEGLGAYITDLHQCWNRVRYAWRRFFICDEDGADIFVFRERCSNRVDDRYDVDGNCTYVPTCSPELRQLLTAFGECACDAATDNDYSGGMIGEFMETMWNRFCPGIELSCSLDGDGNRKLWLRRRYRRFRTRINWRRKLSDLTDEQKTEIRRKIAEYLRMEDDDVSCDFREERYDVDDTRDGSTRRRLQDDDDDEYSGIEIAMQVDDEDMATELSGTFCNQDGLAGVLGDYDVEVAQCENVEEEENIAGNNGTTTTTITPPLPGSTEDEGPTDGAYQIGVIAVGIAFISALF